MCGIVPGRFSLHCSLPGIGILLAIAPTRMMTIPVLARLLTFEHILNRICSNYAETSAPFLYPYLLAVEIALAICPNTSVERKLFMWSYFLELAQCLNVRRVHMLKG